MVILPDVILAIDSIELIFDPVGRGFQQKLKLICAEFLQEFIRVFGIPDLQNFHLQASTLQNGDGALGGILTGLVAIVNENDLIGIAGQ